ncbi:uncharacterized protein LOC130827939 [Amaranthus tricolor]|uniref:uncharacterized protein LOC130827939 n=1 Tax=Amaranthus tricolor TaxID=29722 RepID=UPI002584E8DF|nr:uncharacterized protein LOC130827939 [Amaranthus tricolor]
MLMMQFWSVMCTFIVGYLFRAICLLTFSETRCKEIFLELLYRDWNDITYAALTFQYKHLYRAASIKKGKASNDFVCPLVILQVFSEISRYFTLCTRLRYFDRRLNTRTEAFPSILSLPQGPRKVRKASKASKDENGPRRTRIRPNPNTIRSNGARFGRMDLKLQGNVLRLAGNPEWIPIRSNGCPFGRMVL